MKTCSRTKRRDARKINIVGFQATRFPRGLILQMERGFINHIYFHLEDMIAPRITSGFQYPPGGSPDSYHILLGGH